MIGGGGGAALGALIGKFAGNAAIGAAVGTAVGGGAGALIGRKMDKAAAAAREIEHAQVENVTDQNGLQAVKVTFASVILFDVNKADLSKSAQESLVNLANVLMQNSDMDIAVYGHTDNTGGDAINNPLSLRRAQSVQNYLNAKGVGSRQFQDVKGFGSTAPVADNSTTTGRSQNRRVEIYLYASEAMINEAQNQSI